MDGRYLPIDYRRTNVGPEYGITCKKEGGKLWRQRPPPLRCGGSEPSLLAGKSRPQKPKPTSLYHQRRDERNKTRQEDVR